MQTLNEEQQRIVDAWCAGNGALLVTASAGSGKTRVLTECARQTLSNAKEAGRVLCITFTNQAAEEMQQRLEGASVKRDRLFVGTFHAFGLSILTAYGHELGYYTMPHILEKEADRKAILREVFLQNPILTNVYQQESDVDELMNKTLNWISKQKKKLKIIYDDVPVLQEPAVAYAGNVQQPDPYTLVHKLYDQALRSQNLIEYDDILLLAWRILDEKPGIASLYKRLYKHILVDEAQDLTFAQYEFLKTLCKEEISHVMLVGDPNQSIHGYAGADKKFMLNNFVKNFQPERYEILKNYRSSRQVLRFAQALMPEGVAEPDNQYFEGVAEIQIIENEETEAKYIISKIESLINNDITDFDGKLKLSNVAILARNRFVFSSLIKELESHPIFSTQYFLKQSGVSLQPESDVMKVFDLGLQVLNNPAGEVHKRALLSLLSLLQVDPRPETGVELLQYIINIQPPFLSQEQWDTLDRAWGEIEYGKSIKKFSSSLKILENIELENLQNDLVEWKTAWSKYIKTSSGELTLADFRRFSAMGYNKNVGSKGLMLSTVHTAKGLGFDVVFLMGMNQGIFPDYRAIKSNGQAMIEEKNNAYVAITRAKRHIYISATALRRGRPQQISQFVEIIQQAIPQASAS